MSLPLGTSPPHAWGRLPAKFRCERGTCAKREKVPSEQLPIESQVDSSSLRDSSALVSTSPVRGGSLGEPSLLPCGGMLQAPPRTEALRAPGAPRRGEVEKFKSSSKGGESLGSPPPLPAAGGDSRSRRGAIGGLPPTPPLPLSSFAANGASAPVNGGAPRGDSRLRFRKKKKK